MSGFGERFRNVGYKVPKPLIEIDGKPIIAHIIEMFPGETNFIFICNEDHLNASEYKMEEILRSYCPTGQIVSVAPHKLGPVHAVMMASVYIDPNLPTIVNYCDFTCYWDWHDFVSVIEKTGCDGAIPAYKGFHPHSLGTTNYAYLREQDGWVSDIQEKQPYTNNRMEEYASSGTYYFSSAKLMFEAFTKMKEDDLKLGGEYYVSLAYKPLFADNKKVLVYPLQHFMQWGTPEDVREYNGWSRVFSSYIKPLEIGEPTGTVIVPMAGLGQRFVNEGYKDTKPLIEVSGKPMVIQAVNDLPLANSYAFVLRKDMPNVEEISGTLRDEFPCSLLCMVPAVTEGQACTALFGLEEALRQQANLEGPFTFGACDNGILYQQSSLDEILRDDFVDVVVWGVRSHPNALRNPHMYGWIAESDNMVSSISVKTPLASPETDPIVIGAFTFKKYEDFLKCTERMFSREARVNGEFYLDTCINDALELGLSCKLFEVDDYISWGTPNDLKTFEYWQSCFHKWPSHPYSVYTDHRVPELKARELDQKYAIMVPDVSYDS
tara:strand:+ start:8075 stop:9721 length:1647 start_codon:yes stop_codon:yes gene_type:complete